MNVCQISGVQRRWGLQHVQRWPKQHIDAGRFELAAEHFANAAGIFWIPGRPQSHIVRKRGKPGDDIEHWKRVPVILRGDN